MIILVFQDAKFTGHPPISGLPEQQRAELESANIRRIYALGGLGTDSTQICLLGPDGQVRRIED